MTYTPYTLEDVRNASAQKKFSVISLFAGGGGSSTGYRLAGGDIQLINEFVEAAVETYTSNFPDTPVLVDDIKKYTGQDFLDKTGLKEGELDILDGSPPCSAYSVSSMVARNKEGWNKTKNYSDGKKVENIEDLFLEFVRIAEVIKPKVIVAENVKGITMDFAKPKLRQFIKEFEDIGYNMSYKVMSAADYGVPQHRERTIFIGVRDDVCSKIGLTFLNIHSIFPTEIGERIRFEDALQGLDNDEDEATMLEDYLKDSWQWKFVEPIPFRPKKYLKASNPMFKETNPKGSCFNMIRCSPDLPCPTLTQTGQKKGMSGILHYEANRKLTIKEMKRAMALPDDYVLTGDFDTQAERIGRMVAPKLMKEIANSIYDNVLEKHND